MKALEKLRMVSETLAPCGIDSAEREALLMVTQCLNIGIVDVYRENPEIDDEQSRTIDEMVNRRSKREPLQYILGCTYFSGLRLLTGDGVLIPRPETELMAEHAIKTISNSKLQIKNNAEDSSLIILDLCTGSGCLALALAREFPEALVFGADISGTAITCAQRNAEINGITNVSFMKGHLFEPLGRDLLFDIIISNPPYIRTEDIKGLQPEIKEWEPLSALDGGPDGLDFYREIIPAAAGFLKESGILMLELGAGCADDVAGIMSDAGYSGMEVIEDYAGIKRIIQAIWTR